MKTTYALLACDVFAEELTALGGSTPPWHRIAYLEMGLHDRPDELRRQIQATLARLETDPQVECVVLAYGLCGHGLIGIEAGRCPLVLPRAHDCISLLLGGIEAHRAVLRENPATYFYSPGWIRGRRVPGPDREAHTREFYRARYPDDPERIDELVEMDREIFAHHNCAAYVDLTANQTAEDYCKGCAQHLGWDFKRLRGDRSFLRDLLDGPWDAARFLRVPPGHTIAQGPDGQILAQ